ncbi:hypothetical protein Sste5344_009039 [Sporothrix stenoceras]
MATLLSVLTSRNPHLDTSKVPWGPNTELDLDFEPLGWVPWVEFSYDNLTEIFREQLKARYDDSSTNNVSALPLDLEICNEHTLELALHRFIMPTVNHCLNVSSKRTHYGSGSRCTHPTAKPDWSCIGRGAYHNYVPGDTKLSAKFDPSMHDTDFTEWQKVVGQVMSYQAKFASRYGFIITDDVLVVMRISCERTGPGIAASRTKRVALSFDHSYDGDDTSFANTTASFIDDQPVNWEMNSPEYAIVRWDAHGSKRLTIKLALWCLAMMAVKGGNSIDCSYPALNSWRIEGDRYTHNASGASKTRLGHRDVVQGLDPEAISDWQYAEEETSTSGYGDGSQEDEQEEEENEASEYGEDDIEDARSIHETAGDPGPELHGGESDTGPVGSGNGSRDSDTETIVAGLRRMRVTIKKRMLSRRPYFVDARGRDIDTDITEWTRVRHHYELAGRRHVYVADTFPE